MSWGVRTIGLSSTVAGLEDLVDEVAGAPVYLVGTNVVYGVHLEFGTSRMRSYPWLRPAVAEFNANPRRFVRRMTGKRVDGLGSTDDVVATVALALEKRMTQNVTAGSDRSPGTHPEHPRRDTGNLAADISAVRVE